MNQIFSWKNLARAFIALLTFRVCYLFAAYVFSTAGVQRFHLESAAFLFVSLGFLYRMQAHRFDAGAGARTDAHVVQTSGSGSVALWLAFCVAAFALYRPALSIGFLSDDFTLTNHVMAWDIGPMTSELFRPLPLSIWGGAPQHRWRRADTSCAQHPPPRHECLPYYEICLGVDRRARLGRAGRPPHVDDATGP